MIHVPSNTVHYEICARSDVENTRSCVPKAGTKKAPAAKLERGSALYINLAAMNSHGLSKGERSIFHCKRLTVPAVLMPLLDLARLALHVDHKRISIGEKSSLVARRNSGLLGLGSLSRLGTRLITRLNALQIICAALLASRGGRKLNRAKSISLKSIVPHSAVGKANRTARNFASDFILEWSRNTQIHGILAALFHIRSLELESNALLRAAGDILKCAGGHGKTLAAFVLHNDFCAGRKKKLTKASIFNFKNESRIIAGRKLGGNARIANHKAVAHVIANKLVHRLPIVFRKLGHTLKCVCLGIELQVIREKLRKSMAALADVAQIVEVCLIPFLDDIPLLKLEKPHVLLKPVTPDICHLTAVWVVVKALEHRNSALAREIAPPRSVVPPSAEVAIVVHTKAL